jgi:hypothetical protein
MTPNTTYASEARFRTRSFFAGPGGVPPRSTFRVKRDVSSAAWRGQLDAADRSIMDKRVADLRDSIDRLREDLRRRIGTTRSRLALVNRFKFRCEWHDRDRMLMIADDDRLSGGPEDRLTAEFAAICSTRDSPH